MRPIKISFLKAELFTKLLFDMNVAQPWLIDEDSAVQNISPIERAPTTSKKSRPKRALVTNPMLQINIEMLSVSHKGPNFVRR